MNNLFRLITALTGTIAATIVSGLIYRSLRQREVRQALTIHTPKGITEERFIPVGGIEQWIQIRGENRDNPLLLVLHGGPGWSNATFNLPLRSWEKHFTVIQWDQRGTGKTFDRMGKTGSGEMTFKRRVSDAIMVIEFLRQYLHKDKVILLAESMGTLVGVPLVKRRPDLFSAVVFTDLYVDMLQNEAAKYQMTLERLRAADEVKGIAALETIGADPAGWDLRAWNVNMMWAFKTNVPIPNLDRTLLFPLVLFSPIYNLRNIYSLFSGFQFCTQSMYAAFKTYNARQFGTQFDVPFFLFQGERDVITVTRLAEDYFEEVEAPEKQLALIQNAGHFAAFTQPEQFLTELVTRVLPVIETEPYFQAHS